MEKKNAGGRGRSAREKGQVSQRQQRVAEAMRHELASMLGRGSVHAAGLEEHSLTISEVRISPDMKNATVFTTTLGGLRLAEALAALNLAAPILRGPLARALGLRYAPRLKFIADESFAYAHRIDEILHKPEVRRDVEQD